MHKINKEPCLFIFSLSKFFNRHRLSTQQSKHLMTKLFKKFEHIKTHSTSITLSLFSACSLHNNLSIKHTLVLAVDIIFYRSVLIISIINRNLCRLMAEMIGTELQKRMSSARTHVFLMDRLLHKLHSVKRQNAIDTPRVFICSCKLLKLLCHQMFALLST